MDGGNCEDKQGFPTTQEGPTQEKGGGGLLRVGAERLVVADWEGSCEVVVGSGRED